jgi:hypothetical protein
MEVVYLMKRNLKKIWRGKKGLIATVMAVILAIGAVALTVYWHEFQDSRIAQKLGLGHKHELVPVRDEQGNIKYWTCTMHPSVKSKDPGKCPI